MKYSVDSVAEFKRALSDMADGDEIVLHNGVYRLDEPVVLRNFTNVSVTGEDNVVISGARLITPSFEFCRNVGGMAMFRAKVDCDADFDQLFVNGVKQVRARYPDYDPSARYWNGYAADCIDPERVKGWKNPRGGIVHAMHNGMWGDMHWRIDEAGDDGKLTLSGGHQNNRPSKMHDSIRFVENIFEELDAVCEWYFDKDNRILYYIPPVSFDFDGAVFEVSSLKNLITVENCSDVRLDNIYFTHTAYTFMDEMEPLLRSDWMIYRGGVVFCEDCDGAIFTNLKFHDVGGNAFFVSGKNRGVRVQSCHFKNVGASAVCFVGRSSCVRNPLFNYDDVNENFDDIDLTPGPLTDEYPLECCVLDCLIESSGFIEKQTAGVQISMASHIAVIHCSIYNVPRAGINIGDGTFGGHIIRSNDVFNTVLETGDHGAFNSWGRDRFWYPDTRRTEELVSKYPQLKFADACEPTQIERNRMQCAFGWDIDLDDGSSNYVICSNLCLSGGLKNREGWGRNVFNNIIYKNTFHPHVWYHGSGDRFEHNIIFENYADIMLSEWGESYDQNLLQMDGAAVSHAENLTKKSGMDGKSIIGDAKFVKKANGDFLPTNEAVLSKVNFDIESFQIVEYGVESEWLKKIALTPYTAVILTHDSVTPPTRADGKMELLGMTVKNLRGFGEISATGMYDEVGVIVTDTGENCDFAANDVILECEKCLIVTIGDLKSEIDKATAEKMPKISFTVWRNQKKCHVFYHFS